MKKVYRFILSVFIIAGSTGVSVNAQVDEKHPVIVVSYSESAGELSEIDREKIEEKIIQTSGEVAKILYGLPDSINIEVQLIDRNIDIVDGVTGRTNEHKPSGKIIMEVSTVYPGGPVKAVQSGTDPFLFHEYHHLTRGWSIYKNEFGPGIDIAAVNEGLAVVFAEEYTGIVHEANAYPAEAEKWAAEILNLPKNANYSEWVSGYHPDGRTFIGYRTGNYLVRTAMEKSGKDILELSELSPAEIIELSGLKFKKH